MNSFIYSLNCPIDNIPKYIGKTIDIKKRMRSHLNIKYQNKNSKWIHSLKKNGLSPIVEIIDEVNFNEVDFWEMHYISLYKSWGFDLKNGTIGGEGGTGLKHTEETKMKMSLMRKGKQPSLGRKHSDETKRKIGIKSSQKVFDIEYREKLRLSSTGRKFTLEQKINQSIKLKEYWTKRKEKESLQTKINYENFN